MAYSETTSKIKFPLRLIRPHVAARMPLRMITIAASLLSVIICRNLCYLGFNLGI